jgi:hypothetical protein
MAQDNGNLFGSGDGGEEGSGGSSSKGDDEVEDQIAQEMQN